MREQAYVFRTIIGNEGFSSGTHYWEIIADSRTENEIKVGISSSKNFDFNSAFCDHSFGWAYYGNLFFIKVLDSLDMVRMQLDLSMEKDLKKMEF